MGWQTANLTRALCLAFFCWAMTSAAQSAPAQRTTQARTGPANPSVIQKVTVTVTDENGVAVSGARVELQPPPPALVYRRETDFAGRCEFNNLPSGTYEIRAEKPGFYAVVQPGVQISSANVDVILSRQQEAHEVINVTESSPAIDPAQIAAKEEITGTELLDIPYPGPNDYRNSLIFMPGVTVDAFGLPHFAGAETYQTLLLLDGFNVTQPTNGQLVVQTNIESFRSIALTPSREPAEFGKGSGGVLALNTRMGNDRFRFGGIDFFPSLDTTKGNSLGQWTPIYSVSGPIRKGKMWFMDAVDGAYYDNVVKQLPAGADRDHIWRIDNLAKLQSNLTARNIVTVSFLSNYYHDPEYGLSFLQPLSSTSADVETAYLGSVKDQYYFHSGALLETGFGVAQYNASFVPHGNAPYIQLAPSPSGQGAEGNYYETQSAQARRVQALGNLYLPPREWHGRHDFKVGFDLDRLYYGSEYLRQPISYLEPGQPPANQPAEPCPTDANGLPIVPSITCTRYSVFSGGNYSTIYNTEASAYVEDRWLITNRLLIEPGLRFDWDQIVRTPLFSPRLAGTYVLDNEGNTKLSAGIGILYDNTSLGLIHQPYEGQRVDYFFDTNGCPQEPNGTSVSCGQSPEPAPIPVLSTFAENRNALSAPRYVNWSLGLEKKLPYAIFLKLEFIQKRGTHGFAYNTLNGAVDGTFLLGNARQDRYDAFTISARHHFRSYYEIFGAYTRSSSRTNQVFDFSIDFPLLTPQLPGPFAWDAPNRVIGWGILPGPRLPIIHRFDIVYSGEARNGMPFFATTDQGEIYSPNVLRTPTYYSVNLQFEKRFRLFKRYWALRGGFDNVTNHANSALANSIIDPSHPSPTFIDGNGRAFDSRIRYLGRSN
jgi:hypothetical protein